MADRVKISNKALLRCGVTARISDPAEGSRESKVIDDVWDETYRLLLEDHGWAWATRRVVPALAEEQPNAEWGFRYVLPTDCALVLKIQGSARNAGFGQAVKWQPEGDPVSGQAGILTDERDPVLVYVSSEIPITHWPANFADALAWALANEIAMPLSDDADVAIATAKLAFIGISKCKARDANNRERDNEPDNELIRSRS